MLYPQIGMRVVQIQLGEWDNLNHLVTCEETGDSVLIDPFDGDYWYNFCHDDGCNLAEVWLTHTHWDHVKGLQELLSKMPRLVVRSHVNERLHGWNGPTTHAWKHAPLSSIKQKIGELEFEIHSTPGHTPGHVTILGHGIVISGDCLFLGRCGRTDLFGGDLTEMYHSIRHLSLRFESMAKETLVLPGHRYDVPWGGRMGYASLAEIMKGNPALLAVNLDEFRTLPFLEFDDNLAENARRKRAKGQD